MSNSTVGDAAIYQLAETRWDPERRQPTAHVIHNFR
jgi:hypothetical protein